MKTSTFKKRVEELGFETIGESGIDVRAKGGGEIIAFITGLTQFGIYTYENLTPELFDLIVEYARTPIEERKDERRYRLRLTVAYGNMYLKKDTCCNDELYISTKTSSRDRMNAVFTASEIAEIEKKYNLGSFEREEVIEDE